MNEEQYREVELTAIMHPCKRAFLVGMLLNASVLVFTVGILYPVMFGIWGRV